MTWGLGSLFPGDSGITQTVNTMRSAVRWAVNNAPDIRARAEALVGMCPERDEDCEVASVFKWATDHFRYLRDPRGLEFLKSPEVADAEISANGRFQGDCDDISALMAAYLTALGYAVRFVVIAIPGSGTDAYRHIYLRVYKPRAGVWVALEGTARDKPLGWQAPSTREREYDL